jgi:HK97 family phage major capsid protein
MNEELKNGLEALTIELKGKTEQEVKTAIDSFEAKFQDVVSKEVKEVKESFEVELKALKDHANKLDVKLQEKAVNDSNKGKDFLKVAIESKGKEISGMRKGQSVDIEVKAVGNMSTANLTGDEPRSYNYDIVTFPSQKVNVSDLVGSVNIDGGTYTYTRETGSEGSIGAQTEGDSKNQKDYDFTTVDVPTDFIAGFARYSKKMRNNLSYIASAIPQLLRRDYFKAENSAFNIVLAADATASSKVITDSSKSKMLIDEIGGLEDLDYDINAIVVRPSDYLDILKTAKDDLESAVTYEGGSLRVAGVQVLKATWLTANKYYVGDWSRVNKINTEGLSLEFSDVEGDNFTKNNITARIESQTALAVEQPLALVYGDFTAV